MNEEVISIEEKDYKECAQIIRESFITVAKELNLTKENSPTNPAFTTEESLKEFVNSKDVFLFGMFVDDKLVGTIALEKSPEAETYYMERLSVLPKYRHKGYGRKLLEFSFDFVKRNNGSKISIGIIDENKTLKKWYEENGFVETGKKDFPHLPFRVCFMKIDL